MRTLSERSFVVGNGVNKYGEQGTMRPSLIEVYRGDDYEKTLLPRLQKQSVVWVRNIKAQRPNAFADDVFHTIQHGSDRFERISKGYPCLMIIEGLMTLSV
jgi:hypothetical protein